MNVFKLIAQAKISVDTKGISYVTLPRDEYLAAMAGDIIGIHDDAPFMNSLRYLNATGTISQAAGSHEDEFLPAKHFNSDIADQVDFSLNASSTLDVNYPPLHLYLDHGSIII